MGLFHKTLNDARIALDRGNVRLASVIIEEHLRDEFALHTNMKHLMELLDQYEQAMRAASDSSKKGVIQTCIFNLNAAKIAIEAFEKLIKTKIQREALESLR